MVARGGYFVLANAPRPRIKIGYAVVNVRIVSYRYLNVSGITFRVPRVSWCSLNCEPRKLWELFPARQGPENKKRGFSVWKTRVLFQSVGLCVVTQTTGQVGWDGFSQWMRVARFCPRQHLLCANCPEIRAGIAAAKRARHMVYIELADRFVLLFVA